MFHVEHFVDGPNKQIKKVVEAGAIRLRLQKNRGRKDRPASHHR
jgi:hypothetical protein